MKSTSILLIATLVNRTLRHNSASLRHFIWSLTFASLLLLPFVSFLIPTKPIRLLPTGIHERSISVIQTVSPGMPVTSEETDWISSKQAERLPTAGSFVSGKSSSDRIQSEFKENNQGITPQSKSQSVSHSLGTRLVPLIWSLGILVLLIRMILTLIDLQWLSRKKNNIHSVKWEKTLKDISNRYGFQRTVRLVMNHRIPVPATLGTFRPVLLIPERALDWPAEKRRVVLLHELAHMKRLDFLTNLIWQGACALYWINPMIWIVSRWFRLEREKACDDFVLEHGIINSDYAHHLLDIARFLPQRRLARYAVSMSLQSGFKARLEHILTHKIRRKKISTPTLIISAGLFSLAILPLSIANLQERKKTTPRSNLEYASNTDLINDLTKGHPEMQMRAAWIMGDSENPDAVPFLIETLKDNNARVRGMVAWALGEIKDRRALLPLIESLSDEDDYAREMIVKAVGEFENERTVEPLRKMLNDRNPDIRYAVVWAIGEIGNKQALEAVTPMLKDRSAQVREMAAMVLGKSDSPAQIHNLMPLLSDRDQRVRMVAANVLGQIGSSGAVDELINTLRDREPAVRVEAARALGRIGDPRAVDALIRLLRDGNAEVRAMAVWALDEVEMD